MSRARFLCLPVLLTATLAIGALNPPPAEAMRKEPTLPDCNTASPECREWRQAVEMLSQMNAGGGEIAPKPRKQQPVDKSKAMQACMRYMQRVQKQTATQAKATCLQEVGN